MTETRKKFFTRLIRKFFADETTSLAASLAFYTTLSMAPLLILFVTIASQFSGNLQQNFELQVENLVGDDAAMAVQMVIDSAKSRPNLTSVASALGIFTLLLSASLIFGELRMALNRIYGVSTAPSEDTRSWRLVWHFVKERMIHIGLAVGFIFALIMSLLVSTLISAMVGHQTNLLAVSLDILISLIFYVGIFSAIFRYLPNHHLPWVSAAQGGLFTAILFVVGKQLVGFYIGQSAIGSSYGTAGSVVVLLVWVYYSSIITFAGAQISALLHALPIPTRSSSPRTPSPWS